MDFREEFGEFNIQEAVDAILTLLQRKGANIDEKSFTWILVGALFLNGVLERGEFESVYHSLVHQKNLRTG